jgi:Transposase DDE domain
MAQSTTPPVTATWVESAHASLCALGAHLRHIGFFVPIEDAVHIRQKVCKYRPIQKLEMVCVSLLAGATTVAQTGTTLRVDPALQQAFGLPGCAEQSVLAETLNAATDQDVADLRGAVETIIRQHSQVRQHDFAQALLVLDLDLSPLPTRMQGEGVERGYLGRNRAKTGRKLARVRAAGGETLWEELYRGRTVEALAIVQAAVAAAERLLELTEETEAVRARRGRVDWRLDSGWGSDAVLNWLLERGYQVTAKIKSSSRVRKLVRPITVWQPTSSPGREVAVAPTPVALARPTQQFAVRTPSTKQAGGYQYAIVLTSRSDLDGGGTVDHYDDRAAIEADLKGDKYGLGLGVLRKRKLAAQRILLLLEQLAHTVLLWGRTWLAAGVPRLAQLGIVRLVREVWAIPGRVKVGGGLLQRVRLRALHPRARDVCAGLRRLFPPGQIVVCLA